MTTPIPYPCTVAGVLDPDTGAVANLDAVYACERGMLDGLPRDVLYAPAPVVERPTADLSPTPPTQAPQESAQPTARSATAPSSSSSIVPAPASQPVAGEGHGVILAVLLAMALVFVWAVVPGGKPLLRGCGKAVVGALQWWWRSRTERPPYVFGGIAFGAFLLALVVVYGWSTAGAVAGLAALAGVLYLRREVAAVEVPEAPGWWQERRIAPALVVAGVLKPVKDEEGRLVTPTLGQSLGQPVHREHGTSVLVSLPAGRSWREVAKAREVVESALGLTDGSLQVEGVEGKPASVVRLYASSGVKPQPKAPEVGVAERTTWTKPVTLGRGERGNEVAFQTVGCHSLIVGKSGSGKSVAARIVAAHALLDPSTQVAVISGKSSARDWGSLRPLCRWFLGKASEVTGPAVTALLDEVIALALAREEQDEDRTEPWPGVLVIVEEWGFVRDRCDTKKERDALDVALKNLLAIGRSAGVHVVLLTQIPTEASVPTFLRGNIGQRVVMTTTLPSHTTIGLGGDGYTGPTAKSVGEAVVLNDDTAPTLITVGHLDEQAWREVVERAAQRRPAPVPAEASLAVEAPATAHADGGQPVDLLLDEVLRVLRDGPPEGLPAGVILERVDSLVRPKDATALGKAMAQHRAYVVKATVGSSRVLRLAPASTQSDRRVSVGAPSGDRRSTV